GDARRARARAPPERLVRRPPVALPLRLQVGDLDGHASALTDADGLLDRGEKPVILVAHVARVGEPGAPQCRGESDQLVGRGEAARRVLQAGRKTAGAPRDRKSTRLNSSHVKISYAVFCLKKKRTKKHTHY